MKVNLSGQSEREDYHSTSPTFRLPASVALCHARVGGHAVLGTSSHSRFRGNGGGMLRKSLCNAGLNAPAVSDDFLNSFQIQVETFMPHSHKVPEYSYAEFQGGPPLVDNSRNKS